MDIQWYPGHMAKAKRLIMENLKLVDIVIEILDARVPISSRNPDVDNIIGNKPRLIVLNKFDLSDPTINKEWEDYYNKKGINNIFINSITGRGIDKVINTLVFMMKEKMQSLAQRGRKYKPIRCMIIGIPNVGKSTFINKIAGKSSAKTGSKPGVTKGKQWIRLNQQIELLDTPGILWPKFEDKEVGIRLAWIGSIKDEILDQEELAFRLLDFLKTSYPALLIDRYNIDNLDRETLDILNDISKNRGFIVKGGEFDYLRTSEMLLDEFRKGTIGKISLERP
ncbi:MAG TPA: ribosome biogenesis GTPase YlqF [Eubacteriaceae bacterium]|nr:ribosome biogenesis GTPase YlqF [Eubacteriaceae bacterium]